MVPQEMVPEDGIFSGRFEAVGKQDAGEESPEDPKKERRVKSGPVSRPVFLSFHLSELHNPGFSSHRFSSHLFSRELWETVENPVPEQPLSEWE